MAEKLVKRIALIIASVSLWLLGSAEAGFMCSAAPAVYQYNLSYTTQLDRQSAFEHTHLVAALSGLVNRDRPVLYTLLTNADADWKSYLTSREWLNSTQFILVSNISALVQLFQSSIKGVALYDPSVYATSNLASTASGVYDLLPVCYRPQDPHSLYSVLVAGGPKLPVVLNLVGKFNGSVTGSAKCDAYLWAKDK